ncbi:hypothetical protein LB504_008067, partial [Fusarium proliferatum]
NLRIQGLCASFVGLRAGLPTAVLSIVSKPIAPSKVAYTVNGPGRIHFQISDRYIGTTITMPHLKPLIAAEVLGGLETTLPVLSLILGLLAFSI